MAVIGARSSYRGHKGLTKNKDGTYTNSYKTPSTTKRSRGSISSIGPASGRGTGSGSSGGGSRTYHWNSMDLGTLQKYASGQLGNAGLRGPAAAALAKREKSGADSSNANSSLQGILAQMQADQEASKAANLKRYDEGLNIYSNIEALYASGGAFEQSHLAQLESTKKQDLASSMQSAVSSGMGKTTRAAFSGARWEQEVGAQARLNLESILTDKRAGAARDKAGFIERRNDTGPDYATIANLAAQASNRPK